MLEVNPAEFGAEIKGLVTELQKDLDATKAEVKAAKLAGAAPEKVVTLVDKFNTAEVKSLKGAKGTVEVKAAADMLRANTNGTSRSLTVDGSYVTLPNRPTHIRDFMNIGTLATGSYQYDRELPAESGPGITAEGATKPRVSFSTVPVVATAVKIAEVYKVSDELAHDAPALVRSFQTRGVEMLLTLEDYQILYGSGVGGELQGIMPLADDFNPGTLRVTDAQVYDVLRAAIAQVRKSLYKANAILMNPLDVASMDLTKDEEGRYILPTIFTQGSATIAGVRIVEIDAINEGEFLVGAFDMGVDTFMVQGLRIETTNSDSDDFQKNKIAVRIEERLLQAVTRPSAFVTGNFAAAKSALGAGITSV